MLIQHHGGALLKLGGAERLRSWRAAPAEVAQARQLPDGLLEVEFDREAGAEADPAPGLYVVEIAIGMIPWVPLSQIDGPPEPVLRECRARIDAQAPPGERENIVT